MSIFKTYDVVVVPFPFVDVLEVKKRPALVLSSLIFNKRAGHSILAMITSARHKHWSIDTVIHDLESCGLQKNSLIRLKLFTIDNRLIQEKIGTLGNHDQKTFQKNLSTVFNDLF